MIQQRGDQNLAGNLDLTQRDLIGSVGVLLGRYPLGTGCRLGQAHDVFSRVQRLATAKVGNSHSVLLGQHVHAHGPQRGDQEIFAIQGIGKHHIARTKHTLQACQR